MTTYKRLYRSDDDRIFAGICGGLGEYFAVDPVALRLLWLLVTLCTGVVPGILAYLVAIFIVPKKVTTEEPITTNEQSSL